VALLQEKQIQGVGPLSTVHQGGFHVGGCRWPHHETTKCGFVESHTTIRRVHVRNDLLRVQQNNQMLRKKPEGVDDKVFLCKPNGAAFRHAKLYTDNADIDIVLASA
jgi:hypothetical protein